MPLATKDLRAWLDRNLLELGQELRLSYLPPLMVYLAAGVSGLTSIVGTFVVKEYLGLSAEILAAVGFWAMIPWATKMPLGHLVDLMWRWKGWLVVAGAGLIATGLLAMIGLLAVPETLAQIMALSHWYVLSALIIPTGYVLQDVVADAMTVEAVPTTDESGQALDSERRRLMHTSMQTLGRVTIVGGGALVAVFNLWLFNDVDTLDAAGKRVLYLNLYQLALLIPLLSVLGVALAWGLRWRDLRRLRQAGISLPLAQAQLGNLGDRPPPNVTILGGGLAFILFALAMGLSTLPYREEIVFVGSLSIVLFLMAQLVGSLEPEARRTLVGTAIIIFVYRAVPGPGAGSTWWMIDYLGFDQRFLAVLSLIGSLLGLFGMFLFRRFMAERSFAYLIRFLTFAGTLLSLPILGMYYGLHEWTASLTGGVVDARFIALMDTALESPLGQIAMIPMLAWIAHSAPTALKATYFAVMASFANLALSLNQLLTQYLNRGFIITREVKDMVTGEVIIPADYSELGALLATTTILGLLLPLAAILLVRAVRLRSV